MTTARIAFAVLAAVTWLAAPSQSCAQITTTANEHGNLVFINTDSRVARNGSTISSPSAPSQPTQAGVKPSAAETPAPAAHPAWPPLPPPSADESATSFETASSAPSAPAQPEERMDRIVREAAEHNNLDPALVKAVITTESGWNPRAVSNKGAVGLMQLIPETAQRFGVHNSFDPQQNVEGGSRYLKVLLDRYNGDLTKTLAAYNAGEHTVDLYRGVPAIRETQRYVQKVTNEYFRPGSNRNASLWTPPRPPVRREVEADGKVVFTNE